MSVITLFKDVTAVQTIASVAAADGSRAGNFPAKPGEFTSSEWASQSQAFQVIVTGPPGTSVSATIQPVASNDGIHWANYGNTIAAGSAVDTSNAIGVGSNSPYSYFSAFVTAVSGTGAKVTALLSA